MFDANEIFLSHAYGEDHAHHFHDACANTRRDTLRCYATGRRAPHLDELDHEEDSIHAQ